MKQASLTSFFGKGAVNSSRKPAQGHPDQSPTTVQQLTDQPAKRARVDEDATHEQTSPASVATLRSEPIPQKAPVVIETVDPVEQAHASTIVPEETVQSGAEDPSEGDDDDPDPTNISDYEKLRLARMAENMAFLAQLGLTDIKGAMNTTVDKPKPKSNKRRKREITIVDAPVRRSTRSTRFKGESFAPVVIEDTVSHSEEPVEEPFEEQYYDESDVWKYVFSSQEGTAGQAAAKKYPGVLSDPELSIAYSMCFHPRHRELFAAAGKNGRAVVFQVSGGNSEEGKALLSFRAHGGWVSDIAFVDTTKEKESLLMVTSSNDGSVKVWDAAKQQSRTPRCLQTNKHLHRTGIFTMDVCDRRLLTGGKDSRVCISTIRPDGELPIISAYDEIHSRVVKCVRWNFANAGNHIFASCGDDCVVNILDDRQATPTLTIPDVHTGSVFSVRWHPSDEHLIMTAGKDEFIRLHDIRNTGQPLHSFSGHVPVGVRAIKAIHHPEFCCNGRVIVTAGEQSTKLSFYCTQTGQLLSRGDLGATPSCLLETPYPCQTQADRFLIAAAIPHDGIKLLVPQIPIQHASA